MKTLIASALMLASFAAFAGDVSVSEVNSLQSVEVKTLYSNVGEGRSEFVKRIAPEFSDYTAKTGHEACGTIAVLKNGADGVNPTFSVKLQTIGSQIACAGNAIADGYNSMNTSVHSHPQSRVVRLTPTDMKARGTPAGKLRVESLNTCDFSNQDYDSGAGYLVTCGKVLYQNGRGTDKEI